MYPESNEPPTPGAPLDPAAGKILALPIQGSAAPAAVLGVPTTGQLDVRALLRALSRRWPQALVGGLVCGVAAATAAWFVVPHSQYSTEALLQVASIQPSIIFKTAEVRAEYSLYQSTLITRLKSQKVLNAALRSKSVAALKLDRKYGDPVAWLEKELKARFAGEMLVISMSGSDPKELSVVLNAVIEAFMEMVVAVEKKDRVERRDELQRFYQDYEQTLSKEREIRDQLAESLGGNDRETISLAQSFAIERQAMMRQKLLDLQMQLQDAEVELNVRRGKRDSLGVSESLIRSYVDKDAELLALQSQLEGLEGQVGEIERIARRSDEMLRRRLLQQVEGLKQKLEDRRKFVHDYYAAELPKHQMAATGLDALTERVEILREMMKLVTASLEDLGAESSTISKGSMELERIQDKIAHAESAAERIGVEVETLNVELKAPDRITLQQEATPPRLEADKRPMLAGVAGVGALGMVVVGLSLYEYRARKLGSADEVMRDLGLPLVGTLPEQPRTSRVFRAAASRAEQQWQSWMVESIDAVRTMLQYGAPGQTPRVVLVTSAMAGEGKTSLACHLATSLARGGQSVLLLDADLRKPSIHRLFDLPPNPGFSDLLLGAVDLEEAVAATVAPGLWVLPAGMPDIQAIQALGRPEVGNLFARLRERFDYVVVDSSPTLPVPDALLIGRHADAAICSVLRDVSRIPRVRAANERLSALGIRVVGAVLTGARSETYGASYAEYATSRG